MQKVYKPEYNWDTFRQLLISLRYRVKYRPSLSNISKAIYPYWSLIGRHTDPFLYNCKTIMICMYSDLISNPFISQEKERDGIKIQLEEVRLQVSDDVTFSQLVEWYNIVRRSISLYCDFSTMYSEKCHTKISMYMLHRGSGFNIYIIEVVIQTRRLLNIRVHPHITNKKGDVSILVIVHRYRVE